MIKQDKMFHDHHPVADLLGQISRSNAGSKLSVKFVGQICPSNCWVKLLVEIMDQIPGSNLPVKSAGQTQPILGPMLASLGARMGASTDKPRTGKDGQERGKEKGHALRRGL